MGGQRWIRGAVLRHPRTTGALRWQGSVGAAALALLACLLVGCGVRGGDPKAAAPTGGVALHAGAGVGRGAASETIAIEGRVVGPAGQLVAGALVSASTQFHPQLPDPGHEVFSDRAGEFRFVDLPPGRYGMTATAPRMGAAYGGVVVVPALDGAPHPVVLTLGQPGATFRGTVRNEKGAPLAGARVLAAAFSENEGETYVAHADAHGRYSLSLPPTQRYMLAADSGPRPRASQRVGPASQVVDFGLDPLPAPRPNDGAIRAWLRGHATPLPDAPELDAGSAAAINAIVGDAPFVAMGEATHGSSEFPEWRRRVFQTLVRDRGFTVYAAEAFWAEALVVDDYVVNGNGSAREAIAGLLSWKDDTEEMLGLVEWMRAYNANPSHENKLHFAGFDVGTPRAVTLLLEYLRVVDASVVPAVEPTLAPFAGVDAESTYPSLSPSERGRLRRAIGALVARLDDNRASYVSRTSDAAWTRARQCARTVEQASSSYADYGARDRYMFENIRWLVDQYPPGSKFLLYAHNNHIAAEQHELMDLGKLLRQHWGERYVPIGFAFSEGSLHALDWTGGNPNSRRNFDVDRAPPGTLDHDLSLAGIPRFMIDLRNAEGPMAAWLHSAQRMRSIGGGFSGQDDFEIFTPARAFDALIYLDRVTAIRPLQRLMLPNK